MLDVFIAGRPKPKGRPRFARSSGRAYTPATTKKAEAEMVEQILAQAKFTMATGPLRLRCEFVYKATERNNFNDYHICVPDIDNLVKLVMDACSKAGVWRDDCQVAAITAHKDVAYKPEEIGTRIRVVAL